MWISLSLSAQTVRHDCQMADIDFTVLDVPRDRPPDDAEGYLRAVIAWHFGADTGSPFWLRVARTLEFDPLI